MNPSLSKNIKRRTRKPWEDGDPQHFIFIEHTVDSLYNYFNDEKSNTYKPRFPIDRGHLTPNADFFTDNERVIYELSIFSWYFQLILINHFAIYFRMRRLCMGMRFLSMTV